MSSVEEEGQLGTTKTKRLHPGEDCLPYPQGKATPSRPAAGWGHSMIFPVDKSAPHRAPALSLYDTEECPGTVISGNLLKMVLPWGPERGEGA